MDKIGFKLSCSKYFKLFLIRFTVLQLIFICKKQVLSDVFGYKVWYGKVSCMVLYTIIHFNLNGCELLKISANCRNVALRCQIEQRCSREVGCLQRNSCSIREKRVHLLDTQICGNRNSNEKSYLVSPVQMEAL